MTDETALKNMKPCTPSAKESKKVSRPALYMQTETQAALMLENITDSQMGDTNTFRTAIQDAMENILNEGLNETQKILAANIVTLNVLSNTMLGKACRSLLPETIHAQADIGLRAQEQVRKTILALHQLKNPKQNMYVAQQNVANIQQINNDTKAKPENELISEAPHATLEQRRASETISNDPRIKAMAELYGPENERG
ncbi:MAG: hypothetical protein ACHQAX_00155 [Gammaproteobacteria bacterium]